METEEKHEKQEKSGLLSSLFKGSAQDRKRLPILLLLCGAVGALLLILGGELGLRGNANAEKKATDAATGTAQDAATFTEAAKAELSELLSGVEGAGKTKIYLTLAPQPDGEQKLQGIAVLCEGGNDPLVQKRIIGLLTALYNLGAHRIYVGGLRQTADGSAAVPAYAGPSAALYAYSDPCANIV